MTTNSTSWGYTLPGMEYRRQYRSKPRDKGMSWGAALLCGAIIAGFWVLCWYLAVG